MAIQSKTQRAKGDKNSPKAVQYKPKSMLEPSQHKLEQQPKKHEACKANKGYYTAPITTIHSMT